MCVCVCLFVCVHVCMCVSVCIAHLLCGPSIHLSVNPSDPHTPMYNIYLLQAYSVYDEEVGYCQGLSFLAAALLLHVSVIICY